MLISRVFTPTATDVFYHYCSAETFLAICQNKTMRFSDVNMMNDYGESLYGYRIFEEAATDLLNDKEIKTKFPELTIEFFNEVDKWLSPQQLYSHPVIACFSKQPDVLSQWRAYASDGRGFALGFSGELLSALPVTLLEVEYRKERQILEMKTALMAFF